MRDYKTEHQARKAAKKRLLAEIDVTKAAAFLAELEKRGLCFSAWLNLQIDREMG
jgi:hypothetical protein